MASTAAIAVLATIICLLVVTFLGVFLYHIICTKPGEPNDAEAIRSRRKTPKKHNNVSNIPMENIDSRKSEAKRRKEEQRRQKLDEKERKRQEKERKKQIEAEQAEVVMREKNRETDKVTKMTSQYETMERDRQNRLSRVSERSSKNSGSGNNMNRGSGGGFNYMAAGGDDYATPVKNNRGSSYSGGGSNLDKANSHRNTQLGRENSFRSERSGHSAIGSVSMYSSQVGAMNVGYHDDNYEPNLTPRIDEELVSVRSGNSGLVKARASQWESASLASSSRR